jgi:two-component system, chemotaxis family, chemotaxis protein CheY
MRTYIRNGTIKQKIMKKKILLVDDIREFSKLLRLFLLKNYDVLIAENGLEALSVLQDGYLPDVIVSDIMMPGMDGKEFLRQLKSSGAYRHIPTFILSRIDNSDERIQMLKSGADDFLIKPFNPEELEVRIENRLLKST